MQERRNLLTHMSKYEINCSIDITLANDVATENQIKSEHEKRIEKEITFCHVSSSQKILNYLYHHT